MNIVLSGGKTGGHIYPGLALVETLQAAGHQCHWMGRSEGLERQLAGHLPYGAVKALPLRSKGLWQSLLAVLLLFVGVLQAVFYLRKHRIQRVVTLGGFVSVPVALAAFLWRIPILCFEQNTRLGMANRLIARLSTWHVSGLPVNDPRFQAVGNPLREGIGRLLTVEKSKRHVLIVGGSQGAQFLSKDVLAVLQDDLRFEIHAIVGQESLEDWHAALDNTRIKVMAYCDTMENEYQWADLIICRAGAMTISELVHINAEAILLPLPGSADEHQLHNARYAATQIQAEVIIDQDVNLVKQAIDDWFVKPAHTATVQPMSQVAEKIMALLALELR